MAEGLQNIKANLDAYIEELQRRGERAMTKILILLEQDAKTDHPYTDRTGNNTASIRGFVAEVGPEMIIGYLTAGNAEVNYSAALETRWGGKYAYLRPAIERNQEQIQRIFQEEMRR